MAELSYRDAVEKFEPLTTLPVKDEAIHLTLKAGAALITPTPESLCQAMEAAIHALIAARYG